MDIAAEYDPGTDHFCTAQRIVLLTSREVQVELPAFILHSSHLHSPVAWAGDIGSSIIRITRTYLRFITSPMQDSSAVMDVGPVFSDG
jgi:hypothetical protein